MHICNIYIYTHKYMYTYTQIYRLVIHSYVEAKYIFISYIYIHMGADCSRRLGGVGPVFDAVLQLVLPGCWWGCIGVSMGLQKKEYAGKQWTDCSSIKSTPQEHGHAIAG